MLIMWNFFDALAEGLAGLALMLDGIVYWLVGVLFDLYVELAGASIINNQTYQDIANRFMTIIGVVMLFYLTYSLLKALVNPDELNKSTNKVVMNVIVSLVLISVVPTIFDYAFQFQNAIIEDHVIDNLLLGSKNSSVAAVGKETAMSVFDAFITDNGEPEISKNVSTTYVGWRSLKACIINNSSAGCVHDEGFRHVSLLAPSVVAGDIDYIFIISTICGCFLAYVIASFCLDMGVRVIKLAFYQIISPIPILLRIMPEKKSVFDNWLKAIIATYMEVFIRMFIMFIAIFFCSQINQGNISVLGSGEVSVIAKVVILLGIFAFAKQAPKLLGDVIGVDSGNIKLGIGGKLAASGALGLGAAAGAGGLGLIRNLSHGVSNAYKSLENGNTAGMIGNILKTPFSMAAGSLSGIARGGAAGFKAKNLADARKATSKAASDVIEARERRERYKASHGGTMFGSMAGHAADAGTAFLDFIGASTNVDALKRQQSILQDITSKRKAAYDKAEAEILKQSFERNVSAGHEVSFKGMTFTKLAEIQNEMEIMKNTGKTSNNQTFNSQDMTALQLHEKNMKEQLTTDYLNGLGKDGSTLEFDKMNGAVKEAMVAFHTSLKENVGVVESNLTQDNLSSFSSEIGSIKSLLKDMKDMNAAELIRSQKLAGLMDDTKKVAGAASGNVGTAINEFAEKKAKQENK